MCQQTPGNAAPEQPETCDADDLNTHPEALASKTTEEKLWVYGPENPL